MKDSRIGWCHHSQNFWEGCNHVSDECAGCYPEADFIKKKKNFNVVRLTQTWDDAYARNQEAARAGKCALVFTCSYSDFFHLQADLWREEAWQVIRDCRNLIWLVLTKRPERIEKHLPANWNDGQGYPHVWLGTTCGVRKSYPRIDILRNIRCARRFLSIEPLMDDLYDINLSGIDWVLVGGMSGGLSEEKHMDLRWAARLYDAAIEAQIPFLFKQVSSKKSEWGINALGLYLAERESRKVSAATVDLIRQFPPTQQPLMPLNIEKGRRFTDKEWVAYRNKWPKEFDK